MMKRIALFAAAVLLLGACQDDARLGNARAYQPIPPQTLALMEEKGMARHDPVLIRSYKKESELELWKRDNNGQFALLKTYPICRWSGQLGPKTREGDRQAPEGFYAITPAQMNPNSSYYLSFDTGYPNAYDRANGSRGSALMVHGVCSSRGCYSMTDEQIAEIYAVMRESFSGGQRSVQMEALPFRMTAENMAKHRHDPNIAFWKMLKEGSDHFEVTKQEPRVGVCGRRYVFDTEAADGGHFDASAPCPALKTDEAIATAVAVKQRGDNTKIAELVQKGAPAIKLVYDDGGQHPSFRATAYAQTTGDREGFTVAQIAPTPRYAYVSRPEALERGPREVEIEAGGKVKAAPKLAVTPTAVALVPLTRRDGALASAAPKSMASTAVAAEPVPAVAVVSVKSEDKPFYRRVLSLGGLLKSEKIADQAPAPAAEPQPLRPANVPLPPRRQEAYRHAPEHAAKPQAATPPSDKRAELWPWLSVTRSGLPRSLTAFAPLTR